MVSSFSKTAIVFVSSKKRNEENVWLVGISTQPIRYNVSIYIKCTPITDHRSNKVSISPSDATYKLFELSFYHFVSYTDSIVSINTNNDIPHFALRWNWIWLDLFGAQSAQYTTKKKNYDHNTPESITRHSTYLLSSGVFFFFSHLFVSFYYFALNQFMHNK